MGSVRLTPKGEDYSGNFTYKGLLENLVKTLKVGDIFKVGSRKIRVEAKYPSYVLMMWQGGRMESFVWDDVYKIVNGTYKVRVSDEG